MARTNSANVQAVLLDNYDGSSDLTSFINTASRIADRVATCASQRGFTLSTDELTDIETYLAAYLYFGNSGQQLVVEEQTEKARVKFSDRKSTTDGYLAKAKMVDPSGCLARIIDARGQAQLEWLGKSPSSQIPYRQRD